MAIKFEKSNYAGHVPEIWRGECKMLPAGFKPAKDLAVGTVLHRGTPIYVNFADRTATICKSAVVISGGTTTKPRVNKGSYFVVGDKVSKVGGSNEVTISAIDTTNAEYDVITLSAAATGLVADDIIVESNGTAGTSACEPNAIVGATLVVDGKGLPTIDAAYDAVVLYPSLASPIATAWLNGITLKANPNILFIKQ